MNSEYNILGNLCSSESLFD